MTKKLLLSLLLLCAALVPTQAQEVYMQIHRKAAALAADASGNAVVRQINSFKVDALDYMGMKMKEQMPDSSVVFLDKEALAMNNFMNLYMQTLIEYRDQPANFQTKVMKMFIDASVSTPLFHDSDKELVLAYVADENCLTRFSLDTDWQRAYIAVSMELKKLKAQ